MKTPHHAIPAALLLTAAASAQAIPLTPLPRTLDLLVVDSTYDGVWRISDLNQDGDYNGGNEIISFYDDVAGSVALTNPTCMTVGPNGTAYLADSTVDVVLWMRDANGNGHATDPGEHGIFFDGTNASGIVMASAQGMTADALGALYIAASNTTTVGTDIIIKLVDLNGDGDANDPGEAIDYCTIPNSATAVGDSIPTKVVVGPDLNLYYSDVGATGVIQKGVYKLTDTNFDGDCNDPGEVTHFWTPPAPGNNFYWGLGVDAQGYFYVTDHGNETVWRARDDDFNGTIDPSEETLFYQTAASTWWDVVIRDDGTVLLCEDQTPDRITALQDLNQDGDALDVGEAQEIYSDLVSPTDLRPRGAAFLRAPILSLSPASAQVGTSSSLQVEATKAGDFCLASISLGRIAPMPVAPFGQLGIDPNLSATLAFGIAGNAASLLVPISVPANPNLIGSYHFQVLSGDLFRTFLSNAATLTVTP
jgi:hypothetical protein